MIFHKIAEGGRPLIAGFLKKEAKKGEILSIKAYHNISFAFEIRGKLKLVATVGGGGREYRTTSTS